MKKLELNQMENLNGGAQQKLKNVDDGGGLTKDCMMAIGLMGLGLVGIGLLGVGTAGFGAIAVASLSGLSGAIGMSACHGQL
ncbi:hypothetical protein [Flavobacterium pectinovorum]|uniref:Uncharacterized protein n=1 Tax=Flavobacterium pectinovorum TaxID=29533 RepID=A0A502EP27_9FLAO|nr:hypothetical protein [Flavobacterium pectinovorum]TPG38844.1 hypothetical protein EAH81_15310 [Flavobacterium pectinovorum]